MATSQRGTVASGADFSAEATRRRNVPSASPNGGMVNRVEIDEKKTQAKQVGSSEFRDALVQEAEDTKNEANFLNSTEPTINTAVS